MSIRPCSIHGQRVSGKLATFYNRWTEDGQTWQRYKQQLCVDCATTLLAHLRVGQSETSSDVFACYQCGNPISEATNSLYLSIFPPKQEPREYAIPTCESCAPSLRESLRDGAVPLPNRPGFEVGVPDPNSQEWKDF